LSAGWPRGSFTLEIASRYGHADVAQLRAKLRYFELTKGIDDHHSRVPIQLDDAGNQSLDKLTASARF